MKIQKLFFACAALLISFLVHAAGTKHIRGEGKKYDINGSVVQKENRKPIRDVSVSAYLFSKKEKVVLTDENGNYGFDDLKPGMYKIVFEKEGFTKVIREKVPIKVEERAQLNVEMPESNDFDLVPAPFHFF